MADKLVRKLTNKTTGAPIVGATVVARPVTASGAEGDISMPETPANSGIYATSSQINHSTYKILVGGVDSMDEVTVEPGRAKVRSGSSSFMYPLLDKLVDVKMIVSALLADSSPSATAAEFRSAILAATASDAVCRPLILDQEVTLGTSVDVSQDLHLDLNGHILNLSANITSSTSRITVVGGKINVGTGCKIQGTTTCFVNCEFIGTGAGTFPQVDAAMTFVGCSGLTQLPGAENDAGIIASVAGGQHGFGTASSLRLTTKGTRSGSGRLTALQNWVDQTLSDSVRMGIISWLWSAKAVLDEWVSISPAARSVIANSSVVYDGNAKWFVFQQKSYYSQASSGYVYWANGLDGAAMKARGICPGIRCSISSSGVIIHARAVLLADAAGNSQSSFIIGSDPAESSDMESIWNFLNAGSTSGDFGNVRFAMNAWKVNFSSGDASLSRLKIAPMPVNIEKILASGATPARLKINGVTNLGAAAVLAGDKIVFEIVASNVNAGALEPSVHSA